MRGLAQRAFDFYWGRGIADDVPALTYYLLLSLAPFALGLAALEALLLEDIIGALEVAGQINRFLPDAVHGDIERLVVGARENSPLLIAVALVSMLWTSSGAIGVIERCESRMLDAPRHSVVGGRIRNIALGALVAVGVVAAAKSAPVIGDASARLDVRGVLPAGFLVAVNALGSIALFMVIYRYAPRSRLRWRSALVGAIPAGLALQLVPALVGLYFGAAAGFAAVRVFLLLAVLLIGLYTMAMIMLLGAGLAVRQEGRARRPRRRAAARLQKVGVGGRDEALAAPRAEGRLQRDDGARVEPVGRS
jgi:membrane protein